MNLPSIRASRLTKRSVLSVAPHPHAVLGVQGHGILAETVREDTTESGPRYLIAMTFTMRVFSSAASLTNVSMTLGPVTTLPWLRPRRPDSLLP